MYTHSASTTRRREFLRKIGKNSFGLAFGAGLLSSCNQPNTNNKNVIKDVASDSAQCSDSLAKTVYPFYGRHQAGIITPAQKHVYFIVLDLHTDKISELREVFKRWTIYSARLCKGEDIQEYSDNPHIPPVDTGEAVSLGAYGLTLTFGISPRFLQRLQLSHLAPAEFVNLPLFPRDQIKKELSGGDICIQSCAHDPQVAFHAVRQLVRQLRASVTMHWSQSGFTSFDNAKDTPRNLFGFRDGTANTDTLKKPNEFIWIDTPNWLKDGTYLVARKIQMFLETWDRTSLSGQDDTFGRHKLSGAFMGQQHEFDEGDIHAKYDNGEYFLPEVSHAALAKRSGQHILRRSYSFASGISPSTGQFEAGLMFISFQKSPAQFIAVQSALGRIDKMNEYITHVGSGLFACFGGIKEGEYLGQKLLEAA